MGRRAGLMMTTKIIYKVMLSSLKAKAVWSLAKLRARFSISARRRSRPTRAMWLLQRRTPQWISPILPTASNKIIAPGLSIQSSGSWARRILRRTGVRIR